MEGEIDPNDTLDYVSFQITSDQNRFEASVCSKRKMERLSSGHLDQLELYLPAVKEFDSEFDDIFKLQLPDSLKGSSWFSKSTLSMFLHIVNNPELLKKNNAIQNELNQLEETRRFHLTLYTKDNRAHEAGSQEEGRNMHGKNIASSDDTKNELLRALDLRVVALNEELAAVFGQALGNNCSKAQIFDVATFVDNFGTSNLRDALFKYSSFSYDLNNFDRIRLQEGYSPSLQADVKTSVRNGIVPKLAQAERHSTEESDESSDSSEEAQSFVERSRSTIRAASPRRSASPMRRIQIGRSGSRKATALTIKSLNYFPIRERPLFNREDDVSNRDDEPTIRQPRRPENAILRMSVQDRIHLFENKQKDQNSDTQKKNTSNEALFGAKKSVLRRWSSGMSDSSTPHRNTHNNSTELTSNDMTTVQDKTSTEMIPNALSKEISNGFEVTLDVKNTSENQIHNSDTLVSLPSEETQNRAAASAEWTRQKEAELNQMLMKMMENKPANYANSGSTQNKNQELSGQKKEELYIKYKEKREEKLKSANTGKHTVKESKSKFIRDKIGHRKSETSLKVPIVERKPNSSTHSQKTRRNSSPPVLPKTSSLKPAGSRKASPRTPQPVVSTSCSSLPSASSQKSVTPPAKNSSGLPNRRKPLVPPPTTTNKSALHLDGLIQAKGAKGSAFLAEKSNLKCQEEKLKKAAVTKSSNKTVRTKSMAPSCDDSDATPAKPSFYNKVTKKGSVVPLESKPFLRKGAGAGSALTKTKVVQSDKYSKHGANIMKVEKESVSEKMEIMVDPSERKNVQSVKYSKHSPNKMQVKKEFVYETVETMMETPKIKHVQSIKYSKHSPNLMQVGKEYVSSTMETVIETPKTKHVQYGKYSKQGENHMHFEKESVSKTMEITTESPTPKSADKFSKYVTGLMESENFVTAQQICDMVEDSAEQPKVDQTQFINDNARFEEFESSDLNFVRAHESKEPLVAEVLCSLTQSPDFVVNGVQADDDLGISSSAWVDVEHEGDQILFETEHPQIATHEDVVPETASSPRIRSSLSQMLLAETAEPEIVEWGNAEIPPALVYQKDAPKGFKRLLRFNRKSKGESVMTDFSSPPVFYGGEEDVEEPKISNKKDTDTSSKRAGSKSKAAVGLQKAMVSESYDGENSRKISTNHSSSHQLLSASMNNLPSGNHKLREGLSSATSTSTKGSRSFFSLSTFRSNKSNESK
ncbi:hypothetical protein ZOSMA_113G00400 [Zostera marina]|uniref:Uncharacterized protein n=1 Tax=Zostera marina TaxID=29655 RepID=A0A0K9Q4V8_ZOSMR|nr:hypothetical protein ZOSMA_113G00400 [Zostera marina]